MNFKNLATVTAFICFMLAAIWIFFPSLLLTMWDVDFSYQVGLVSRRCAALFAGTGTMFFYARNAGPSAARSAIALGFMVGCFSLASLGIFEFVGGHAGIGILSAVFVETGLGLCFIYVDRFQDHWQKNVIKQ